MIMNKPTYEWSWKRLSLWQNVDHGSSRIFTLWPPWLYRNVVNRIMYGECPFVTMERWLKRNGHWDDEDFMRAICWWYANHSAPGTLVKLNPKIFGITTNVKR